VLSLLPLICVFAGIGPAVALLSVDRSSGFHIVSTGVTGSCSEKRAKQLEKVDTMIERYRDAVEDFDESPNSDRCARRLSREMSELKSMMAPDAEYSVMASQRIRAAFSELF
jgi:hypothetical protein